MSFEEEELVLCHHLFKVTNAYQRIRDLIAVVKLNSHGGTLEELQTLFMVIQSTSMDDHQKVIATQLQGNGDVFRRLDEILDMKSKFCRYKAEAEDAGLCTEAINRLCSWIYEDVKYRVLVIDRVCAESWIEGFLRYRRQEIKKPDLYGYLFSMKLSGEMEKIGFDRAERLVDMMLSDYYRILGECN